MLTELDLTLFLGARGMPKSGSGTSYLTYALWLPTLRTRPCQLTLAGIHDGGANCDTL